MKQSTINKIVAVFSVIALIMLWGLLIQVFYNKLTFVLGMFLMALLFYVLLCIIQDYFTTNIHEKMTEYGDFTGSRYNDVVNYVSKPTRIEFSRGYTIAQWVDEGNLFRDPYSITMVFDENDNFVEISNQCFFQHSMPNIWVGVRF